MSDASNGAAPPGDASSADAEGPRSLEGERAGFSAGAASCAVKIPSFEGPLDLLLHLCRESELDISNLPIALISEQYLEYLELMRGLDIDIAAEYLLMAATLAHIKSRILLPVHEGEEEAEGEDPRAELARRLALFAAFRQAAEDLGRRPLLGRDVFSGARSWPESRSARRCSSSISPRWSRPCAACWRSFPTRRRPRRTQWCASATPSRIG
jgi:segregation and condensation protein A